MELSLVIVVNQDLSRSFEINIFLSFFQYKVSKKDCLDTGDKNWKLIKTYSKFIKLIGKSLKLIGKLLELIENL